MKLDLVDYFLTNTAARSVTQRILWRHRSSLASWAGTFLMILLLLVMLHPLLISHWYITSGARLLDANGDIAEAARLFERARDWSSADPEIDRALARVYLRLGQPQRAVEVLERAFRLRSESLLIREELATAYAASGQAERAIAIWADLGVKAGDMLVRGDQAREAKRYAEALAWYQLAQQGSPDIVKPLIEVGKTYREAQQLDQSLDMLRRAVTLAPANHDGWYELGVTYAARKEWQQALEAFQAGLHAGEGEIALGNLYYQVGYIQQYALSPPELEKAWASYEQALLSGDQQQSQLRANILYQRGVLLAWREQWREAAEQYRQALTQNPSHYIARVALSRALWHLDQRDAAMQLVQDAIERSPARKEAYYQLGIFYQAEGDTPSARRMYERVLEIDPRDQAVQKALEALP